MANGFMDIGSPISGGQGPSAVLHLAKLLAIRTALGLIEQLGLFDRKILDDLLRDGPSNLAGSDFNASKRGFRPSEVVRFKIDVKFFRDSIEGLLVFQ
jgi:hypothetical protein